MEIINFSYFGPFFSFKGSHTLNVSHLNSNELIRYKKIQLNMQRLCNYLFELYKHMHITFFL